MTASRTGEPSHATTAPSPPSDDHRRAAWLALAAYACLASACTWPVAAHLRDSIVGYAGFENTEQTLWLYAEWKAYVATAARDLLGPAPLSPAAWSAFAWTVMSFSAKVSMANGIDFAFTWPLEAVFGAPAYYNVKCLLVVIANAMSVYGFARVLGCRPLAAWCGGATFAFNPYTFYLLATGRVIECIIFPCALYASSLWRAWNEGGIHAVKAGAWLGVATLVFWFNLHFLVVYTVLFVVVQGLLDGRAAAPRIGRIAVVGLVAAALIMPAAMPYLVMLARGDSVPGAARGGSEDATARYLYQTRSWSCDLDYGWRPLRETVQSRDMFNPPWLLPTMHTYDGLLMLAAVAALFALRRSHRFFITAFVLLYTLPLGPVLKSGGRVWEMGGHPIVLPFTFLVRTLPFLDHLFFPTVTMGLWTMVAGVVIALGIERLADWRPRLAGLGVALVASSALHMHALGQWPVPSTPLRMPPQYAAADEGFIYLPANLPFWRDGRSPHREHYVEPDLKHVDMHMALHGRKSLWGRNQYLAGADLWMFQPTTARANTFLAWLLDNPTAPPRYDAVDYRQVRDARLRYLVVMERLTAHQPREGDYQIDLEGGVASYDRLCARLRETFGPPVYEGTETTWEKYIVPTTVIPHDYRMSVFDMERP